MATTAVVFLGSKPIGYWCLKHLIDEASQLNVEVRAVLTKQRAEFEGEHDLSALASAHGIPVLESPDELPACDILLSVQYHQILTPAQLSKASQIAVNLHMAPLPEYRGSNQFTFAILEDKTEFGTTLHVMDPRIDHGPILAQRRWKIPGECWVEDLYARTVEESMALFKDALPDLIAGRLMPVPQHELESTYGSSLHLRREMAPLKQLDLSWPKEKIEKYLRATYMPGFEAPYAVIAGRKVHFVPEKAV